GEKTIKCAEVYACLGYLASSQRQMDKAREYFEKALSIKRDLLGSENGEYKANDAAYHKVLGSALAPAAKRGKK
ncbi:tetratricopeptide repeat protein, partial [Klebsiella pneumoniae]|uniref:tetratricopeptide repeat protein n=1 Tax=Klebsiella pneumoniae TaxID=573 RepID=UPI003B9846A0